jgi:mono/diheme cytochrome c family protein
MNSRSILSIGASVFAVIVVKPIQAQLVDLTTAPNAVGEGISKSFDQQIGAGRGSTGTPGSSLYIIKRDPFRSIRRGRQVFQRKFTKQVGQGPVTGDGTGDVNVTIAIGAGLADSCAACHGRPRGAAGSGGDVVTRPDSRDAPHLFGLGLKEMLADEITSQLRAIRTAVLAEAKAGGAAVTKTLTSKGIHYGNIRALPNGSVDTGGVRGVNPDLRIRPFFMHGGTISIREFVVGAFKAEMGLEAVDPDLAAAAAGARITTPAGMVLDGALDKIEAPPTSDPKADPDDDNCKNEIPTSIVDHMEFYLLNYFKPAVYQETVRTAQGRALFMQIGCASCHIPDLRIERDRRVADVETVYDPTRSIFNGLFATATALFRAVSVPGPYPAIKEPKLEPFLVRNIFTDFKRHDLGPAFHERNYDGTILKEFLTTPLWGVGTTGPYGHDGRSINLAEVILRHGGEAQQARDNFAHLADPNREDLILFLNSLVLFPPDDTASNLNPGDRQAAGFPQNGHGSIKLTILFNDPSDIE